MKQTAVEFLEQHLLLDDNWRRIFEQAKEMEKNQNLNRMKEEILEAKRRLYLLLMKLNEDSITDNEVDIMFLLSKDEQIQSLFETQTKK